MKLYIFFHHISSLHNFNGKNSFSTVVVFFLFSLCLLTYQLHIMVPNIFNVGKVRHKQNGSRWYCVSVKRAIISDFEENKKSDFPHLYEVNLTLVLSLAFLSFLCYFSSSYAASFHRFAYFCSLARDHDKDHKEILSTCVVCTVQHAYHVPVWHYSSFFYNSTSSPLVILRCVQKKRDACHCREREWHMHICSL